MGRRTEHNIVGVPLKSGQLATMVAKRTKISLEMPPYSIRNAFLEHAVVVLVYKFNEKSTASVNVSRPLKCHSNHFGSHIHIQCYTLQKQMGNSNPFFGSKYLQLR